MPCRNRSLSQRTCALPECSHSTNRRAEASAWRVNPSRSRSTARASSCEASRSPTQRRSARRALTGSSSGLWLCAREGRARHQTIKPQAMEVVERLGDQRVAAHVEVGGGDIEAHVVSEPVGRVANELVSASATVPPCWVTANSGLAAALLTIGLDHFVVSRTGQHAYPCAPTAEHLPGRSRSAASLAQCGTPSTRPTCPTAGEPGDGQPGPRPPATPRRFSEAREGSFRGP